MEEEKAAAYYDELSRKGEGAARFKQGLGFSSASPNSDPFPSKPNTSSSSLFSTFVRASNPRATSPDDDQHRKQVRLEIIQNKLKKDRRRSSPSHSPVRDRDRRRRRRSPSLSPDREVRRRRSRDREERRHRSSSRERRRELDRHRSSRDRDEDRSYSRSRRRSRSRSPSRGCRDGNRNRRECHVTEAGGEKHRSSRNKSGGEGVDYSQLIDGYTKMTPAERVKAKMKLQLSETVAKDTDKGSGWERFDFNKEAPLDDDDDEIEAADDDAAVVKDIGRSFRLSAVEAKREEEIKAAHDNAMFGASAASTASSALEIERANDNVTEVALEKTVEEALISDKVIALQQSSWRDRARRFRNDSES